MLATTIHSTETTYSLSASIEKALLAQRQGMEAVSATFKKSMLSQNQAWG
jgi:hypothetical protein